MLVAAILAVVVAALALIIGESGAVIRATPETFANQWVKVEQRLAENPDPDPVIFELAPGTYTYQWDIAPSHNGLQVRGAAAGVILQAPNNQALMQVRYVHSVEFARARMESVGDTKKVMLKESKMEWHAVHCLSRQTAVTMQESELHIRGFKRIAG